MCVLSTNTFAVKFEFKFFLDKIEISIISSPKDFHFFYLDSACFHIYLWRFVWELKNWLRCYSSTMKHRDPMSLDETTRPDAVKTKIYIVFRIWSSTLRCVAPLQGERLHFAYCIRAICILVIVLTATMYKTEYFWLLLKWMIYKNKWMMIHTMSLISIPFIMSPKKIVIQIPCMCFYSISA